MSSTANHFRVVGSVVYSDRIGDTETMDLNERVEKIVASWPKLTDRQLDRVAALLRGGSRERKGR